jgi:hypothetical protein
MKPRRSSLALVAALAASVTLTPPALAQTTPANFLRVFAASAR